MNPNSYFNPSLVHTHELTQYKNPAVTNNIQDKLVFLCVLCNRRKKRCVIAIRLLFDCNTSSRPLAVAVLVRQTSLPGAVGQGQEQEEGSAQHEDGSSTAHRRH